MQAMVDPETILTEMTSRVFLHTLFYYLDFFRHLLLYLFFMVSFLCDISGPFFKVHIHWNFRYVSRLFVIPLLKSGTRICTNGAGFMCLRHSFLCQYIVHKHVTCFGKYIVRKILNMSSLRLNITWRSWICKPWIYWSKKLLVRSGMCLLHLSGLTDELLVTGFGQVGYLEDCSCDEYRDLNKSQW